MKLPCTAVAVSETSEMHCLLMVFGFGIECKKKNEREVEVFPALSQIFFESEFTSQELKRAKESKVSARFSVRHAAGFCILRKKAAGFTIRNYRRHALYKTANWKWYTTSFYLLGWEL